MGGKGEEVRQKGGGKKWKKVGQCKARKERRKAANAEGEEE